jgi:hypothetical protein
MFCFSAPAPRARRRRRTGRWQRPLGGGRDVDSGNNSPSSVDAKRPAIQPEVRFPQLSCAGDAIRSEKPPAVISSRGLRFAQGAQQPVGVFLCRRCILYPRAKNAAQSGLCEPPAFSKAFMPPDDFLGRRLRGVPPCLGQEGKHLVRCSSRALGLKSRGDLFI